MELELIIKHVNQQKSCVELYMYSLGWLFCLLAYLPEMRWCVIIYMADSVSRVAGTVCIIEPWNAVQYCSVNKIPVAKDVDFFWGPLCWSRQPRLRPYLCGVCLKKLQLVVPRQRNLGFSLFEWSKWVNLLFAGVQSTSINNEPFPGYPLVQFAYR